jgi:hypothetical protein
MPRICRPINPMEGRDYLTLDGRVRPLAVRHHRQHSEPGICDFESQLLPHRRKCCRGVPVLYPRGWLATHARISIEPPYGV